MSTSSPLAADILGPSAAECLQACDAATQRYLADYRATPPAGRSQAQIDAYCEGFKECAEMFIAVIVMRSAK